MLNKTQFMMEILLMVKNMGLVNNNLLMVTDIKDNIDKEKFKVKELFFIIMAIHIKGIFSIINLMAKVSLAVKNKNLDIKVIFCKDTLMDKEKYYMTMEMFSKDNLEMDKSMAMEL